jgi:prolipoprotein diacylglyceryltransferase
MDPTAVYIGSMKVSWAVFVILPAVFAWFFISFSLYCGKGKTLVIPVMFPLALVSSLVFARLLHWYSHYEMYESAEKAVYSLTDVQKIQGGFETLGILAGVVFAAFLAGRMKGSGGTLRILDAVSPGTAFLTGLLFLSDRFNENCRSSFTFSDTTLTCTPFFVTDPDNVTVRLAVYFCIFILMTLAGAFMLVFYTHTKKNEMIKGSTAGNVFFIFLALYGAVFVICDSMRYDASYLRSNGFVSIIQIVSALFFIFDAVYFSIRAMKGTGFRGIYVFLWLLCAAGIGITVLAEYRSQRFGSMFVENYALMAASLFIIFLCIYGLYHAGLKKKDKTEKTLGRSEKNISSEINAIMKKDPSINLAPAAPAALEAMTEDDINSLKRITKHTEVQAVQETQEVQEVQTVQESQELKISQADKAAMEAKRQIPATETVQNDKNRAQRPKVYVYNGPVKHKTKKLGRFRKRSYIVFSSKVIKDRQSNKVERNG